MFDEYKSLLELLTFLETKEETSSPENPDNSVPEQWQPLPMKILVTGGAGFIGSHLVDALLEQGHKVAVVDNMTTGTQENISRHADNKNFQIIVEDIRNRPTIENIFISLRPDVVFHLAAQINVRDSIKRPLLTMEVNVDGTVNILEAMVASGCKRIIFSSTGGVMFSEGNPPYREEDTPSPVDPYAISKRSGELLLDFYSKHHGIQATSLRYANVYGPRQNPKGEAGVVAIFLDQMKNDEIPTIYGD